MGGAVDGGVGNSIKLSPYWAAAEKVQAELRQEYNVREERRRELEFLEKGGNPLDFKFRHVACLSLQSTSLADRHPEQLNSSGAKGSFSLAASPAGDSVESSDRPGLPSVSGQKSTDSRALLSGENEIRQGERNSIHLRRKNNITSSGQSSQMDGCRNAKESEDSAICRPYARRNRRRTKHDGAQVSSADGQGSFASRASIRDMKGSSTETNGKKETPKLVATNGDMVSRTATPESCLDGQIDVEQAFVSTTSPKQIGFPVDELDVMTEQSKDDNQHIQPLGNRKPPDLACPEPGLVFGREGTVSDGTVGVPPLNKEREIDCSDKLNGSRDFKGDSKNVCNEVQVSCEAFNRKSSDCSTRPGVVMDLKKDSVCNDAVNIGLNGNTEVLPSETEKNVCSKKETEKNQKLAAGEVVGQEDMRRTIDSTITASNENHSSLQNQAGNGVVSNGGEETSSMSDLPKKLNDTSGASDAKHGGQMETQNERKEINAHSNSNLERDNFCNRRSPVDMLSREAPSTSLSGMEHAFPTDCQTYWNNLSKKNKAYEDSVLEEARIIQAKHKRIAELSGRTSHLENWQRYHWNFVLEEMTWLSNDFAQERLWKMTAAAQLCHQIACLLRSRCEEQSQRGKLKLVAHNLAKSVLQFWHTAEESSKKSILQPLGRSIKFPIEAYAIQFLRDSNAHVNPSQVQAPKTPDIVSDVDMLEVSWDDHLTEESLFYTIPCRAMETYRKSIEAYVIECERTGVNVQEEVATPIVNTIADQGYQENAYDGDEAETSAYYMPRPLDGSKSSKFTQKKRKNLRFYERGADLLYGHCTTVTQPSALVEKKPANLTIGPIPAKRMRSTNALRQRVLSPFGTGAHCNVQAQVKTEDSSGDTNSFHDDQNSLLGGLRIQNGVELESAGDFEKHISYDDYAETLTKPKKKNKARHLDSTFEPVWQMSSTALNEQREQSKKRMEDLKFNGTSGVYAHQNAKKPRIMKHSLDGTRDNIILMSGSMPCPVVSQTSNMSGQNKSMRYVGGRDRSRKARGLKASSLHSGPGSAWSLFEDQALVVLVHDMGPNWELVSDAINSTLQFKCIFRKPKDCKERHKFLMDKSSGDGADSAEDSGSSQSYPSTLPGIPKGSARQLFQRLQGPVEEDTLKEHFDKIIQITQRQHHQRIWLKNGDQDLNQTPVDSSRSVTLSKVCPNNLSGVVLSPLDLMEANPSSPDVLQLSYQCSHASNLAMQNQGGSVSSALATSGVNSPAPGSSGFVLGNNIPPASARDGRYNVPKTSSSRGDEQQRMQPYNQMLSNRAISQSNMSIPGAVPGGERGVRVLPGGNGLGMNRTTMPVAGPGFTGMASSPMLNSSSMLSSPMVGAQSPVNMHAGSDVTQVRPRESIHVAGGGHKTDQQRQMPAEEFPVHVTQGSGQGVSPFNGIGPTFSNQTASPVQTYSGSQQQQHQMYQQQSHAPNNPHHPQLQGTNQNTPQQKQIYLRIAKERHLHQQYLQQQQQFRASNSLVPNVQSPSQLTTSSPPQNSPQIQPQSLSQPASLPSLNPSSLMTPIASQMHREKNQFPDHGHSLPRNSQTTVGGLTNQVGPKQRQRQAQLLQLQQSGRAHPHQRPQAQPHQQQAKVLMGLGRGNMLVDQKFLMGPSHLNTLSVAPGSIRAEDEVMQQGRGLYSRTGTNQVQPSKSPMPQAPHQSQILSGVAAPHSTKQHLQQPVPSHSENTLQGQFSDTPPRHNTSSAAHQAVTSTLMNQHVLQPQPRQSPISQTQTIAQNMHPQNHQHMNYEQLLVKSQPNKAHVADQKHVSTMSQAGIGSPAAPATAAGADSAIKVVVAASPAVLPEHKVSEAGITSTSTQVGAMGSPTQLPSVVQGGLGQRCMVEDLPNHGHGGSRAPGALAKQLSEPLPPSQHHDLPQLQEQHEKASPQQQSTESQPHSQP